MRYFLLFALLAGLAAAPRPAASDAEAEVDPLGGKFSRLSAVAYARSRAPHTRVHAALLGDAAALARALGGRNARVLTRTPSVLTALLEYEDLLALAARPDCVQVEVGWAEGVTPPAPAAQCVEVATPERTQVPVAKRPDGVTMGRLDAVRAGAPPLPRAPTGAGVVLAVVESGGLVDLRHPDFRNEDGSTRFLAIWDQGAVGGGPPADGASGVRYDRAALDRLLAAPSAPWVCGDRAEHATASAGVAAGNGGASGRHRGVAYEASLVAVRTRYAVPDLIDAVRFAFDVAHAAGQPCVVTISELAAQLQGRAEDGRDVVSSALSELVAAEPGRAIVASAGNNGRLHVHAHGDLGSGDGPGLVWRLRPARSGVGVHTLRFAAEVAGASAPRLAFACVDATTGKTTAESEPLSWGALREASGRRLHLGDPAGGFTIALVPCLRFRAPPCLRLEIEGRGEGVDLEVRLRGAGAVDTWTDLALEHLEIAPPPAAAPGSPPSPGALHPDALHAVPSPASAPGVIAVGAYFDGRSSAEAEAAEGGPSVRGAVAPYSQAGGPLAGSWKPLLVAPTNIEAALPLDSPSSRPGDGSAPRRLHAIYGGTSCAAPVLAGAIALHLELQPAATADAIRSRLARTARSDDATGTVPNPRCGHGKLDFAAFVLSAVEK